MPTHDIDFVILPEDGEQAAKAHAECGMRIVHPPEGWLLKAFDGDNMVDLIFRLAGRPVGRELLDRAEEMDVAAVRMPVLSATDLVISWLLTFSEHHADFADTLTYVRPLREQVDWRQVREQTAESAFAHSFLVLLERLKILPVPRPAAPAGAAP